MFYCEILSGLWIMMYRYSINDKFIKDNSIDIILNCSIHLDSQLSVQK